MFMTPITQEITSLLHQAPVMKFHTFASP